MFYLFFSVPHHLVLPRVCPRVVWHSLRALTDGFGAPENHGRSSVCSQGLSEEAAGSMIIGGGEVLLNAVIDMDAFCLFWFDFLSHGFSV